MRLNLAMKVALNSGIKKHGQSRDLESNPCSEGHRFNPWSELGKDFSVLLAWKS
jgi:hypothetical protein